MPTNEQTALNIEAQIREHHAVFRVQMATFSKMFGSDATIDTKRAAFLELLGQATDFFNVCEQSVGDTSLLGAHRNEAWARNKAETCLGVLETILEAHETWATVVPIMELPAEVGKPSATAYASLQRMVAIFFPEKVPDLRRKFVAAHVPVVGFDSEATEAPTLSTLAEVEALRKEWVPFAQDVEQAIALNPMGFVSLPKIADWLVGLESEGARLIALHAPWLVDQWSACGFKRRPTRGSFERRGLMVDEVPLSIIAAEVRERLALLDELAKEVTRAEEHAKSASTDYFHVLAQASANAKPVISVDFTRERLMSEVVEPLLAGHTVRVDGYSINADVPVIKITRTSRPAATFAREYDAKMRKLGIADLGTDRKRLPFEQGEDVTTRLLGTATRRPAETRERTAMRNSDARGKIGPWGYAGIAAIAFACAVALLVGLTTSSGRSSAQIFYVLLITLGLAGAAFLFGAMKSYARFKGKTGYGAYELGGPVCLLVLVVLGGFRFAPPEQTLSVLVKASLKHERVSSALLSVGDAVIAGSVRADGVVRFDAVPTRYLGAAASVELHVGTCTMKAALTELHADMNELAETVPLDCGTAPAPDAQLNRITHHQCQADYFNVSVLAGGILNAFGAPPSPRFADARLFQLLFSNTTEVCTAIVSGLSVEILEAEADPTGPPEATTVEYNFEVQLNPSERGTREFARPSLNYTPFSAPEKISIDVKTIEYGWDYTIRFVVEWEDVETRTKHTARTPTMIAAFPQQGAGLEGDSQELFAERGRKLRSWQERFDGKITKIDSRIDEANQWQGGSELCPQNTAESASTDRFGPCRFEKRGNKVVESRSTGRACLPSERPDKVCLVMSGCPKGLGRVLEKASFGQAKQALMCDVSSRPTIPQPTAPRWRVAGPQPAQMRAAFCKEQHTEDIRCTPELKGKTVYIAQQPPDPNDPSLKIKYMPVMPGPGNGFEGFVRNGTADLVVTGGDVCTGERDRSYNTLIYTCE